MRSSKIKIAIEHRFHDGHTSWMCRFKTVHEIGDGVASYQLEMRVSAALAQLDAENLVL